MLSRVIPNVMNDTFCVVNVQDKKGKNSEACKNRTTMQKEKQNEANDKYW